MRRMSVLYPVAETAEAALSAPRGFAARERTARELAQGAVAFVTEMVGPVFPSEAAALDAYAGRVDDDRPDRRVQLAPEQRWCELKPVAAAPLRKRRPITPVNRDGRRWPEPQAGAFPAGWRLSVSYWKVGGVPAAAPAEPARKLRRSGGETLQPEAVRALAHQPLQPVRPQQPLDIGLFETRPPEAPHIVMPDE
jgi:hypothetical protein